MLVHTVSNNFYLKSFSISSKTGQNITVEMANFFLYNYVFRMFQKFHSPKQIKYLLGDFSKVNSHLKQQFLLKKFFYKFKNLNYHIAIFSIL
jgi:hypothetical protein